MPNQHGSTSPTLGFFSVVEHARHGYFGGLLALDCRGRPLEFHCTTPVKPTRAQEILYGVTLQAFLFGQQLGCALFAKANARMDLCLVADPRAIVVADHVAVPVVVVSHASGESAAATFDAETGHMSRGSTDTLTRSRVLRHAEYELVASGDEKQVEAVLARLAPSFDLLEPFERIQLAIDEAERETSR